MDIYSILKEGLKDEGSDKMWCITRILSDSIEEYVPEKQKETLLNKVYYSVNGGHYDRELADKAIEKFYYYDSSRTKHQAPYWTEADIRPIYRNVKTKIPAYTLYDFEVAMNMIKSDNCNKLRKWFPEASEEEILEKLIEETVNYLDDEDNPYGTEKLWKYLNG